MMSPVEKLCYNAVMELERAIFEFLIVTRGTRGKLKLSQRSIRRALFRFLWFSGNLDTYDLSSTHIRLFIGAQVRRRPAKVALAHFAVLRCFCFWLTLNGLVMQNPIAEELASERKLKEQEFLKALRRSSGIGRRHKPLCI
jgi:hypothetical protein